MEMKIGVIDMEDDKVADMVLKLDSGTVSLFALTSDLTNIHTL